MSDPMTRDCDSCFRNPTDFMYSNLCEDCLAIGGFPHHKFPEEVSHTPKYFGSLPGNSSPLILPEGEKFPLDKLIDDHWMYVESTLSAHECPDIEIEIAKHHYINAAYHFWKHCKEHYGIEDKDDA